MNARIQHELPAIFYKLTQEGEKSDAMIRRNLEVLGYGGWEKELCVLNVSMYLLTQAQ